MVFGIWNSKKGFQSNPTREEILPALTTRKASGIGASEMRINSMKLEQSLSVITGLASSIKCGRLLHCSRYIAASKSKKSIVRYFTTHAVRSLAAILWLASWDGIRSRKDWIIERVDWY